MTKLSKREITLLILLVIALCGALYYNFVLKAFFNQTAIINAEMIEVTKTINDSKAKSASILTLDKSIKTIQDEMTAKFRPVLDSIDRPAIIVMLNKNLASQAANITYQFSPTFQDLKSNYITTVQATFQCTQAGFTQILLNLKAAEYVNRVITASYAVADPNTDSCEASVAIEILTGSLQPSKTSLAG